MVCETTDDRVGRATQQRKDYGLLDLSVRTLASRLRDRSVAPREIIEELAGRIEAVPKAINPFVCLDLELAHRTACDLERTDPADMGALHGIPLPIKDIVPTRDLPTTWGMAARVGDDLPRRDGSFVAAARRLGAVIYGKTNTSPNAYADVTDNLVAGATANPHDTARTPGGSSGGAGAVVAARLGRLAHGTDAGGSVRIPAALCGVVGFKPSYGRLPRIPAPDLWNARGHHGLIARSVDDIAYAMDALVDGDPRDPLALERSAWDAASLPRLGRVAFARSLFGQDVDAAVEGRFLSAVGKLADAGVQLEEVDPRWPDPCRQAGDQMAALEFHHFGERLAQKPDSFDAGHAAYIRRGSRVSLAEFLDAQMARTTLYSTASEFMREYDCVLTPALPLTAWRLDEARPMINGRRIDREPGSRWPDALLANLLGWPAISVPAGWTSGLPVGLQIMAPWRADRHCLAFAAEVERVLDVSESPSLT